MVAFQMFTARNFFYSNNSSDWLSENLVNNDVAAGLGPRTVLFAATLDCVWCNRNEVIFTSGNHSIGSIIHQSENTVRDFWTAKNELEPINVHVSSSRAAKPIVRTPPLSGLIKINCDATVSLLAGGGVARDLNGRFL